MDIVVDIAKNNLTAVKAYIQQGHALDHKSLALRTAVYTNNIECFKLLLPHSDIFAYGFNGIELAIYNNCQDIFDLMMPCIKQNNDKNLNDILLSKCITADRPHMTQQMLSLCDVVSAGDTRTASFRSGATIKVLLDSGKTDAVALAIDCLRANNEEGFEMALYYAPLQKLKNELHRIDKQQTSTEFFNRARQMIEVALERQTIANSIPHISHSKSKSKI